jgi:hypothetical protein
VACVASHHSESGGISLFKGCCGVFLFWAYVELAVHSENPKYAVFSWLCGCGLNKKRRKDLG